MGRCQICGHPVKRGKLTGYHQVCIKRLYGCGYIPKVAISSDEIPNTFKKVEEKLSIAYIQPQVRLTLKSKKKQIEKSDHDGEFILKSQTKSFPNLPKVEHICMTAAHLLGIAVPVHSLVQLQDGAVAFLERRHPYSQPIPVKTESFCEVLGRSSKYSGDLFDIGRKIWQFSEFPGLDVQLFFEMVLFYFIIGHSDFHLKGFFLVTHEEGSIRLAEATGMLSDKLYLPDCDDFAMPMNNKTNDIRGKDFLQFALQLKIHEKAYSKLFLRFFKGKRLIGRLIKESTLSTEEKIKFSDIVNERFKRLFS
jgi:serine/threonine-protein kinase HipA